MMTGTKGKKEGERVVCCSVTNWRICPRVWENPPWDAPQARKCCAPGRFLDLLFLLGECCASVLNKT